MRYGLVISSGAALGVLLSAGAAPAQDPAAPPPSGPSPLPAMVQWHKTPGGAQYAEISLGQGPTPRDGQVVVMHFSGWLDDGTQFDSTHKRGKPFGFTLGAGQVISGWEEGVRGMRPGGKRRLIVPPSMAYGERGVPQLVPPNAALVFDIEVLRISDQPPAPPPGQQPQNDQPKPQGER